MGAQAYRGGCHCGAVRYEVVADLDQTATCNCSRCQKLGWILTFVPAASFSLVSGEDRLADYQFGRKAIHHLFCRDCGIESFARGVHPKSGEEMAAVNVSCLDDVDPSTLSPKAVDGRSI